MALIEIDDVPTKTSIYGWDFHGFSMAMLNNQMVVGNGNGEWGCWDGYYNSDDWDHSRKFPAFSTSKFLKVDSWIV